MKKKKISKILFIILIISFLSTPLTQSQIIINDGISVIKKTKILKAEKETFELNINVLGEGSYSLDPPGGVYEKGTVVTVTAIPSNDYRFTQWGSDSFDVEFESTGWFQSYQKTDSFTIKKDTNLYVGFIKILIEYVDFFIRQEKSDGNWGPWEDECIKVDVGTTLEFKMTYKFSTNVIFGFSGITLDPFDYENMTYPPDIDPEENYFDYIEDSYYPKKVGHPRLFLIFEPEYDELLRGVYWLWMGIKKYETLTQTLQAKVIKPFTGDIAGSVSAFDLNIIENYFSEDLLYDYVKIICESPEEPILSIDPKYHDFEGMLEGETNSTSFEIWNSGQGNLEYSLFEDCSWLDLSSNNGNSNGEHDEIIVNIDTTNLDPDQYICNIDIDSNGGENEFIVSVTVYEEGKPAISIIPNLLDFGQKEKGNIYSEDFIIKNVGDGLLDFDLSEKSDWIESINPPNGELNSGESTTICLTINTSNLSLGFHSNDIDVLSDAVDDETLKVQVNVFNKSEGVIKLVTGRKFSNGVKSVTASVNNLLNNAITNVSLDLSVTYGFFSKNKNDRITIKKLEPNERTSIQIDGLKGFGPVYLEASANADNIDEIIVKKRGFMIFGFIIFL